MKNKAGFTVIEALVILAFGAFVLGIVFIATGPRPTDWVNPKNPLSYKPNPDPNSHLEEAAIARMAAALEEQNRLEKIRQAREDAVAKANKDQDLPQK